MKQIRGTHPQMIRSGVWAELVGECIVYRKYGVSGGQKCYVVKFLSDGFIDLWSVEDPLAGYEFREKSLFNVDCE
jgi:hypothetical protein